MYHGMSGLVKFLVRNEKSITQHKSLFKACYSLLLTMDFYGLVDDVNVGKTPTLYQ